MKTTLKSFIWLMVTALMLISCEKEGLDPLTGKYAPPEVYDFTVLNSQNREKDGSLYKFSIDLSDAESHTLNMKFTAADYILPASDYTPSDTLAKNTYLIGSDGSTCNGQQISSGTVSISLIDSNYTMKGILYLADETVVKMSAAFTIAYQPDPYVPTYTYSVETATPAMGGAQGDTPIDGSTMNKITVFADDVFFAYFEVVSEENATSLSGTYSIKDGLDAIGQINNGYYLDWSWWGGSGILEAGSYYIKSDEKMFLREGEGDITITDDGGTLTITGDNLGILDVETLIASSGGTWTTLPEPGSINIQEATEISDVPQGFTFVNTITAPATYGGWAATEIAGSQLNVIKIIDANNDTVAAFELITAEGATDLSGDYNVLDGTATDMAIGDANNGYYLDMTWYGQSGITMGGCYYTENSETNYIRSGSVIHVEDNGGVLTITGTDLALLDVETLISSSGGTWQNLTETGSCSYTSITPAGGSGEEGVSLTNMFSATATDNTTYGGVDYTITLKISTEGITATYNETTYGYDYTGDGNFVSIDFHTAGADLIAGTYNIVATGSDAIGDCIAGYEDPYFGTGANWGSVWGTVASDAASDVQISSGTVDVAIDGDTYTITVDATSEDGAVNATYSGSITIQ